MINHSALYKSFSIQFREKWMNCPNEFPDSKKRFSLIEKYMWELKFDHFLNSIKEQSQLEEPNSKEILNLTKKFFQEGLAYSNDQLALIFSDEMVTATKDFILKSWEFDPNLKHEEVFQALRNIWIILGLQSFFGKDIRITPSLLAYSLLYPYTDNFIDDASISKDEKQEFCQRFALRLGGTKLIAKSEIESRIFSLVKMIESEFDRCKYPKVYESLLDIHHAQTKSIELLGSQPHLSEEESFQICIIKGATSVIADGYLILGELNENQLQFLFEYGAYLQILDDLQDAKQDYQEGTMTCFSRLLPHKKLDQILCKTYYLGKSVLETINNLYPNEQAFYGLIKRSFGLLFLASITQNQQDFSQDFIHKMEKHSPFRFSFLQKRVQKLKPIRNFVVQRAEEFRMRKTSFSF